jgi:hypothetical protein
VVKERRAVRLLLHAIAPAEVSPAVLAGLRSQPLVRIEGAGLAAWATELTETAESFGRADLLEHHEIISRLAAQLDGVLPARFPTWLADADALRGELTRRQCELVEALDRVRGRVELAVTALWTTAGEEEPPPEAATPGLQYLLTRQHAFSGSDRRRARAQELLEQIGRLVGTELIDVRHQLCPSATVALSSALLVPRARAEIIKTRLIRPEQDVRILVNGPWPPYTFATVV